MLANYIPIISGMSLNFKFSYLAIFGPKLDDSETNPGKKGDKAQNIREEILGNTSVQELPNP